MQSALTRKNHLVTQVLEDQLEKEQQKKYLEISYVDLSWEHFQEGKKMKSILNSTIILLKKSALTNLVLSIIEPR